MTHTREATLIAENIVHDWRMSQGFPEVPAIREADLPLVAAIADALDRGLPQPR